MAKRVCAKPGCPTLVPTDAYRGLCDQHRRERDKTRGTKTERGYGPQHEAERARIQHLVDAGLTILCSRCNQPIRPGQRWSPDHNADRTGYLGPSHEHCNLKAAGKAAHGL
jgi:hypothetical protein